MQPDPRWKHYPKEPVERTPDRACAQPCQRTQRVPKPQPATPSKPANHLLDPGQTLYLSVMFALLYVFAGFWYALFMTVLVVLFELPNKIPRDYRRGS